MNNEIPYIKKEQFHSAEGPCFKRARSLFKQINRIWYKHPTPQTDVVPALQKETDQRGR